MQKLIDKFAAVEAPVADDEGAVTIEYVLLAAFVVTLGAAFTALGIPAKLATSLNGLIP